MEGREGRDPKDEGEGTDQGEECLVLVRTDRLERSAVRANAVALTAGRQERIRDLTERFQRTLDALENKRVENRTEAGKGKKRKRSFGVLGLVAKVFGEDAWLDVQAKVGVVFPGKGGECWAVFTESEHEPQEKHAPDADGIEAPDETQETKGDGPKARKTHTPEERKAGDAMIRSELLKMVERGEDPSVPLLLKRMEDTPFSTATLRKRVAEFRNEHKEKINGKNQASKARGREAEMAPPPKQDSKYPNDKDTMAGKKGAVDRDAERTTIKEAPGKDEEESQGTTESSTSREESPDPPPKVAEKVKKKDSKDEETKKIWNLAEKVEREKGRVTIKLMIEACDRAFSRAKIANVLREYHASKQDAKKKGEDKTVGTNAKPSTKGKAGAAVVSPEKKGKAEESSPAKKGKVGQGKDAKVIDPSDKKASKHEEPSSTSKESSGSDTSSGDTRSSEPSESDVPSPLPSKKKEETEKGAPTSSSGTSSSEVTASSSSSDDSKAQRVSDGDHEDAEGSDGSRGGSPTDREVDEMFLKRPDVLSQLLDTPEGAADPKSKKRARRQ
eukprot:scaffold47_cov334-Pavlova_lutheri.AAC.15